MSGPNMDPYKQTNNNTETVRNLNMTEYLKLLRNN